MVSSQQTRCVRWPQLGVLHLIVAPHLAPATQLGLLQNHVLLFRAVFVTLNHFGQRAIILCKELGRG